MTLWPNIAAPSFPRNRLEPPENDSDERHPEGPPEQVHSEKVITIVEVEHVVSLECERDAVNGVSNQPEQLQLPPLFFPSLFSELMVSPLQQPPLIARGAAAKVDVPEEWGSYPALVIAWAIAAGVVRVAS